MANVIPNAEVEYIDQTGKVVATDQFRDPGLDENSWLAREMKKRGVWRGPYLAYGCGRKLAIAALALSLAACSSVAPRVEPAITKACAEFRRAEASPAVQLAVVGGSMVHPAVGPVVSSIKAYGDAFCRNGAPAGDTTSTAERAAWLAGVTAEMVAAAR